MGKVVDVGVFDRYFYFTIQCPDGSIVKDIRVWHELFTGLVVAANNNEGYQALFQTDIKKLDPKLFPEGSTIGISLDTYSDPVEVVTDSNRIIVVSY